MIYCNKCARILDEDVQFCPICNEEDPDWQAGQENTPLPQSWIQDQDPTGQNNTSGHAVNNEVIDRLREINKHVEENIADPPENTQNQHEAHQTQPSVGLYTVMIMVAVCFSCVGLIMGIVFITNKNKNYQYMGYVILAVSITFMIFGVLFSFLLAAIGV